MKAMKNCKHTAVNAMSAHARAFSCVETKGNGAVPFVKVAYILLFGVAGWLRYPQA